MSNVIAFPAEAPPEAHIITFEITGDPVAFARAGSNGTRRFTPPKQRKAMIAIRNAALKAKGQHRMIVDKPIAMEVLAMWEYPKSWPKWRRVPQWRIGRPDLDNVYKLLGDSLNGFIYEDDAQVAVMSCAKMYGPQSKIVVTIHPIKEMEQ